MTMGIVTVASLAARVGIGPAVTMTSTLRRTSSAAKRGKAIEFSLCISPLNDNVFPLHVPKLAQTLPECLDAGRPRKGRSQQLGILSGGLSLAAAPQRRAKRKEQRR